MASIKDVKRMCKSMNCSECPLSKGGSMCILVTLPNNADELVDKWVSEHPIKTYAMDFFDKFPDAQRKVTTGIPIPCIGTIYSEFRDKDCPVRGCSECWNREMKRGGLNE